MGDYEVRIVERDGTAVRTLVGANVERIVEELNAPGEVSFTFPKYNPIGAEGQGADVQTLRREVQVYRDDTIVAWAVPVHPLASAKAGDVGIVAPGVAWYFGRRYIDKPRHNYLTNPSFEGSLSGWTALGVTASDVVPSSPLLGGDAAQLVQASVGVDTHLDQTLTGLQGGEIGLLFTLAGWFYIVDWDGPALDSRGLYVEGIEAAVVRTISFETIDDASPQGKWQRAKTTIWIPPGETWDLNVRLYAPGGTILWDAMELVVMESLSVAVAGTDLATVANNIVAFIQDEDNGKSDLAIGRDTPATGITVPFPKAWQFADHTAADRALNDELVPLGIDWSIEFDETTKTFTTYSPMKGTDRSATVTLQLGVNVADYDFDEDGAVVTTDLTLLGEGDGPDREEGRAVDTSSLDGLVLQGILSAPPGTILNALDQVAVDLFSPDVVKLPTIITHEGAGELIELLEIGDTVAVVIDDGWVQVDGTYRIVRREIECRTDTMRLTLNES